MSLGFLEEEDFPLVILEEVLLSQREREDIDFIKSRSPGFRGGIMLVLRESREEELS